MDKVQLLLTAGADTEIENHQQLKAWALSGDFEIVKCMIGTDQVKVTQTILIHT